MLEDYLFALQDCSVEAVRNIVNDLRAGKIEDASTEFSPKAPKLATFARAEQARLNAIIALGKPKAVTYAPVSVGFKDWRIIHRQRADELRSQGYWLVSDNAEVKARQNAPAGSIFLWSICELWAPPARIKAEDQA